MPKDIVKEDALLAYISTNSRLKRPKRAAGYKFVEKFASECRRVYRRGCTPSKVPSRALDIIGERIPSDALYAICCVRNHYWNLPKKERGK